MQDWLAAQATARPTGVALILEDGQTITFGNLHQSVDVAAHQLSTSGIAKQDIVGIWIEDKFLFVIAALALMRLGAILLPLNLRLTAAEVQWQLAQAECRKVLVSSLSAEHFGEKQILIVLDLDYTKSTSEHQTAFSRDIDLSDTFAVMFTSGTSGQPKAAMLTYSNIFYSAMSSAYRIGVLPDDCWLCVLPLYHIGGLSIIMRSILYGTSVRLSGFDVDTVNYVLTHHDISLVSLVPTMLHRLLEHQASKWNDKLRLVLLGGAAPSRELIDLCLARNIPVATTYGLTEAASQVATALPSEVLKKPESVGKPILFTSVRITDNAGNTLSTNEVGEIRVSGPTVFAGYFNDPEATTRTLRDRELCTGDMGYFDANGDLYIVNRRSDLIVTGGENVYPAEVEAVLREHPSIADVAVIGIDDDEWGQVVAAAVVLKSENSTNETEIIQFCRRLLAGYKIPRQITFVKVLPQTASGKIHRAGVQLLFEKSHED